ncbi:hypothetical protein J7E88_27040 [Streptomyces sp. ISL-10]|uniref:hypothetical protein n=1 Tax=Streptomyces sp. ISL-10 TaxID=2819172 RepID=UPI001BE6CEB1|nr:hypothetical protein [Streptomyces sp. ISL-10]MBT2368875.1 hypothetical protein [Streptomyces sp. ISL-10]
MAAALFVTGCGGDGRTSGAAADGKVLGQQDLERAVVTEKDLPGRTFDALPGPVSADITLVDPSSCQAVADAVGMSSPFPPKARVKQVISSAEGDHGGSMMLASYPPDQAAAIIPALHTALDSCRAFTPAYGFAYEDVTQMQDPGLGNGSAAFHLLQVLSSKGKKPLKVPVTVTVVRAGATLLTFQSTNTKDSDPAVFPQDAVDTQLAKLADATR